MKTIEEIRQANRERVLKHISLIAYQRELKPDEANKLNLMLDIGKTIPEILSSLRRTSDKSDDTSCGINLTSAAYPHVSVTDSGAICLRTPLEMYFHRYVSR